MLTQERYKSILDMLGEREAVTVAELAQRLGISESTVRRDLTASDEDKLGFTYAELDRYIREGVIEDEEKKARIDRLHRINLFKLQLMPAFEPDLEVKI